MASAGQHGIGTPAVFGAPDGPVLTIEYCAPCNYLPRTLWHAQELLASLATSVSALRLVPADNGRYTVTLGMTELFSKEKEGRFPEVAELLAAAFATLAPAPAPVFAPAPAFAIRTIDVSPFLADPASTAGDKAARDLGDMLQQAGFAVITGHGVPETLIEQMETTSREFFALPIDEKMRVVWPAPDILRGYQPILADARYPSTEGQSANLVETLMINQLDPPQDTPSGSDEERHWRSPNLWPEHPAALRQVWEQYYRRMTALSDQLMAMCARALGLPDDWFSEKFERHFSNLVANFYPGQPEPPEPGQVRNAAHTDHGSLTLLYRDSVPGLQVHHEGQWYDVPWRPDSFVVNIGDMIARWTNGRWRATPHRVVNPPRELAMEARLSVGYFQQPNPDLMIEPAPQLVTRATPARYRPVHCGHHVMAKELRHQRTGATAT